MTEISTLNGLEKVEGNLLIEKLLEDHLLISGNSGTGKSTLILKVLRELAREKKFFLACDFNRIHKVVRYLQKYSENNSYIEYQETEQGNRYGSKLTIEQVMRNEILSHLPKTDEEKYVILDDMYLLSMFAIKPSHVYTNLVLPIMRELDERNAKLIVVCNNAHLMEEEERADILDHFDRILAFKGKSNYGLVPEGVNPEILLSPSDEALLFDKKEETVSKFSFTYNEEEIRMFKL